MPFQSEKQRRYLWANEPEIARDWADTYGSRIEKNEGGIMRLGFDNGGEVVVDENDLTYEESPYSNKYTEDEFNEVFGEETIGIGERLTSGINTMKDKFTRGGEFIRQLPGMAIGALAGIPGANLLMQGLRGPQLTPQQMQMNKNYMANYGVTRDQTTGRMIGGPFAGMNAPGTSAFGSKDVDQMATKWLNNYGHTAPTEKVHQMSALAGKDTGNPAQMGMGNNTGMSQSNKGSYSHPGSAKSREMSDPFQRGGIAGLWPR